MCISFVDNTLEKMFKLGTRMNVWGKKIAKLNKIVRGKR
jgi:hypothetical protein